MDEDRNRSDNSLATLLLRLALGVVFLFFGIGKFPDYSGYAEGMLKNFSQTWLPSVLLYPFVYALPFVEAIGGALLIIGLFTRKALVVIGVLSVLLVFGMVVQEDPSVVARNAIYVLITAFALTTSKDDRYSVDALRSKGEK